MNINYTETKGEILNELQSYGIRIEGSSSAPSRRGGAGPSDHTAVSYGGKTVMVPVHTLAATNSPYLARTPNHTGISTLERNGETVGKIKFATSPNFYDLKTKEGIPYFKIATLHSKDVLATTVLQNCIRYKSGKDSCQFCAIGQSLEEGRTIAYKTPAQLAEVASAAVALDGVKQMVMTTGTTRTPDRGASILTKSAMAIKEAVNIPIQGQCEPPADDIWFQKMHQAGIDSLGMHLECVTPEVRERVMPGKAQVPLERYYTAYEAAVKIFGRGEVSTYIIAGLGDTKEEILRVSEKLIKMGVYPFVVPFVPISGTPMENYSSPSSEFMHSLLKPIGTMLKEARLFSAETKAGCAKCGACSALNTYEK